MEHLPQKHRGTEVLKKVSLCASVPLRQAYAEGH
jgi:hypothetical protein